MAKKTEETPQAGEAQQPVSFEEALAQLQEIVRALESGERSLDDSLKLYERGVASLRACHALLDRAEQRIRKLVAAAGGKVAEEPFATDEYAGETAEMAARPGDIASGTTQVMKVVTDETSELKPRKPSGAPRRVRGGKDNPLFSE